MSQEELMKAVRGGKTVEVTHLLDAMTDAERRACLPALKELRKELRTAPWTDVSRRAYPALHAAGAACHTGAAGAAAWIAASDLRWSQASAGVLLHVLDDREPAWLGDVAHRLAARPVSAWLPYALMSGLVRLAGCEVPTTDAYVQGWVNDITYRWKDGGSLLDRLRREAHLTELVGALFETDDIGSRVELRSGDDGPDSWTFSLARLTEDGVLERKVMVDACVARLLRGGSLADNRAFLRLLQALDLTRDEERERTADWIALAADAPSVVAAHAQSVLGALALDGELSGRQLVEMSGGVLFRPEKKLVRAQLTLLGKALRRDPSGAAELLPAVTDAFTHEDTDMQERALKLVERYLDAAGDGARDDIVAAAVQLSAGLRPRAAEILGILPSEITAEAYEDVLPPVPEPRRLAPPPGSAAEVAEEVGALLASGGEDVAVFERTLDGLVRQAHRDKDALVEALRPVLSRRWWRESEHHYVDVDQHFRQSPDGIEVVLASLLDVVRTETLHAAVHHGSTAETCRHTLLERPLQARLWEAAFRMRTEPLPFLLATPTWESGLLEPDVLVARLAEYQRLGARPGAADFAQALLRVRRDGPAGGAGQEGVGTVAEAVEAAAGLGTPEGDRLAAWLVSGAAPVPPSRRRTSGPRVLVELGELAELQEGFPREFRALGRPVTPFEGIRYWCHWNSAERRHWLAVLPGRAELVAARLLRDMAEVAVDDSRGEPAYLPLLAEADGPTGDAVHLSVAYGLGARHAEDRLSAVDALLVLAARGRLDGALLGAGLGELITRGAIKPVRLAEALRTAAATGAYATVWSVLRDVLPPLLAANAEKGAAPMRGLGDLVALAAECAERAGGRGDMPHLADVADRRGTSRLVTQARRLRTALALPLPA